MPLRLVLALGALALAMCADAGPDAVDLPDDEVGVVIIAVDGVPTVPIGTVILSITEADSDDVVYSYTEHLTRDLVFREVRLIPGDYDISVEISTGAQTLYVGSAEGVSVVAKLLTHVTIELQQTGGVSVLVDLAGGGTAFADKVPPLSDPENAIEGAVASHGSADGSLEYVLMVKSAQTARMYHASSLSDLIGELGGGPDIDFLIPDGDKDRYQSLSLAYGGADLFLARKPIFVAGEGTTVYIDRLRPGEAEFLPHGTASATTNPNNAEVHACALHIDDRFHLFCGVGQSGRQGFGLVYASSPDGRTWSELLPHKQGAIDPIAWSEQGGVHFVRSIHAAKVSGAYRVYANIMRSGTVFASSTVMLTSSIDLENWTPLDPDVATVFSKPTSAISWLAVELGSDGWEMLYQHDSKVQLAVSP